MPKPSDSLVLLAKIWELAEISVPTNGGNFIKGPALESGPDYGDPYYGYLRTIPVSFQGLFKVYDAIAAACYSYMRTKVFGTLEAAATH